MWIKFLPYIIPFIIGIGLGSYGTLQLAKLTKQEVRVSCPACPQLPKIEPCPPQIDFDKIKSKHVTIEARNVTNYIVNGDSLFREKQREDFLQISREVAKELNLVRAKK